jgi:tRNA U34 5-methylaminomethyl-2-thiouridine-forming methyltransferase MnmC
MNFKNSEPQTLNSSYFTPQETADGSYTFFSSTFNEAFHSLYGAKQEAQKKFVEPCALPQKAQLQDHLFLLDVCYGLGYNTASALETIWQINPRCQVSWFGLEFDPLVPLSAIASNLLTDYSPLVRNLLTDLAQNHEVKTELFQGKLLMGDARIKIDEIINLGFKSDAIFLDPFSPPKCPQLWTVEFLAKVSQCLQKTGKLATYSCSASVRKALLLAGLFIGSTPSIGRKSPSTIASFQSEFAPLSQEEIEHLNTRASIPYRDPHLNDPASIIIQRREIEQAQSTLETTSKWKKRWQNSAKSPSEI